jgi:UPF0716 family protein affecting phage T7 exclusion
MFLLLLIIGWFIAEIWAFAEIGGEIGGGTVVLWVFASAFLGIYAIKRIAMPHFSAMRTEDKNERGDRLFRAICVCISGIMLMTPGFVSDGLALLLLIPVVQTFCRESILDGIVGAHTFGLVDTEDLRDMKAKYKKNKESKADEAKVQDPHFASDAVKDADFEVINEADEADKK